MMHLYLYMQSYFLLYILTFTFVDILILSFLKSIRHGINIRGSSDPPRRSFVSQAKADKAQRLCPTIFVSQLLNLIPWNPEKGVR